MGTSPNVPKERPRCPFTSDTYMRWSIRCGCVIECKKMSTFFKYLIQIHLRYIFFRYLQFVANVPVIFRLPAWRTPRFFKRTNLSVIFGIPRRCGRKRHFNHLEGKGMIIKWLERSAVSRMAENLPRDILKHRFCQICKHLGNARLLLISVLFEQLIALSSA